jgi:glucokinase
MNHAPSASYIGLQITSEMLRGARVTGSGRSIADYKERWVRTSAEGLMDQIVEAATAIDGASEARAVGVAIPGVVAGKRVHRAANLSALEAVPLAEELSRRLGRPVLLENDANAAALAEAWRGAGRGGRGVLYVSLGVGIGAGVVIEGRLWSGASGYAGEIGHLQIDADGTACSCGSRGCLETIAGAAGWIRLAKRAMEKGAGTKLEPRTLDSKTILSAVEDGDAVAREVVDEVARALGMTLAPALALLNVDRVVIGGAPIASPFLLQRIIIETRRRTLPAVFAGCAFQFSELNEGAGVLGAARVARVASMFGPGTEVQ